MTNVAAGFEFPRRAVSLVLALVLAACVAPQHEGGVAFARDERATSDAGTAHAVPAAEQVFHADPLWLGGDAAISIPLSPGRILWMFGDSFVATREGQTRRAARIARNTIAIQEDDDLRRASLHFHWRRDARGEPAAFFPGAGRYWYWPGHGIRLSEGPLVVFLTRVAAARGGLGFKTHGYALAVIDNPDAPPGDWRVRIVPGVKTGFDALPACGVIRQGDDVIAVAVKQERTHAGALVRYPARALARADLSQARWWAGPKRGWMKASALGRNGVAYVLEDAGAECSLHWDARAEAFVHVATQGFGASTIALRTAPAPTGPWSAPHIVYRPPEAARPEAFVYSAKAHPEQRGPKGGDLIVTYAASSFRFEDLLTAHGERSLYWPRVVAVPIEAAEK